MIRLLRDFIPKLLNWVLRRRSPALTVMRHGIVCIGFSFGAGWYFQISYPFNEGQVDLSVNSSGGTPALVVYLTFVLGLSLVVIGLVWEVFWYRAERRVFLRKKVVVVEARGLRNLAGTPLIEVVPQRLKGLRELVLVDIRQRVEDGEIVAPNAALESLISLPSNLMQREGGLDLRDLTLVYGGLTPVPFTFLTGVLIDDERAVVIMDWDRHSQSWRELDGDDDGRRFELVGLERISHHSQEVALAVSVSYQVDSDDVRARLGEIPIVALDLEGGSPDCHWSEKKQQALGTQFLNAVVALGNLGIGKIHLFLAAQNSVSFRFGRLYDKRNLPEIVVYQYKRGSVPPYPWGIRMPVCGNSKPTIVGEQIGELDSQDDNR